MTTAFFDLTKSAFGFLEEQYGFDGRPEGEREAVFDTDTVRVRVVRSMMGTEHCIYVTLTYLQAPEGSRSKEFTMGEIVRAQDATHPSGRRLIQFDGEADLPAALEEAAGDVKAFGRHLLQGSLEDYNKLGGFRRQEIQSQELDSRITPIRRKALTAWSNKDYAQVVKFYGAIESHLTRAEKKRLTAARRKLN